MNLGKSVKKLASEFNVVFSLSKCTGTCKSNSSRALEELKRRETVRIPNPAFLNGLNPANLYRPGEEKINFIIKNDIPLQKKIEEPGKIIKIKIKLPVENVTKSLDLPCSIEKEIQEPVTNIISKRAVSAFIRSQRAIKGKHIMSIRRRKMRIHKRKKYMRKHKVALQTRKRQQKMKAEYDFQMKLKEVIKAGGKFAAEEYVTNTLKAVHWQRPVTKVRGILAPQWVIKEFLNKKSEKKALELRLEECINSRK